MSEIKVGENFRGGPAVPNGTAPMPKNGPKNDKADHRKIAYDHRRHKMPRGPGKRMPGPRATK
ncbi:hypothetical protein [uncultured Rikenella sp.]|uniref:hypothetical protein n=1 Tax=uncultured Rikenella sp. TaxID=368003 RepID=UPI002633C526|nr:hypothetical protein [uncultured Rikenella sp.]